jgi:hypothetical protein
MARPQRQRPKKKPKLNSCHLTKKRLVEPLFYRLKETALASKGRFYLDGNKLLHSHHSIRLEAQVSHFALLGTCRFGVVQAANF